MRNIIEHLTFRARLEPGAIAIRTPEHQLTFLQLQKWVTAVAGKLRRAGVRPGQFVVTSIRARQFDWIFTLAICHEAAISCSATDNSPLPAPLECDWMLSDSDPHPDLAAKTIRIDDAWLAAAHAEFQAIAPIDYESEDSVCRVVLTSGTTGSRKGVAMTVAQLNFKAQAVPAVRAAGSLICLLKMTTQPGTNAPLTCLIVGSPFHVAETDRAAIDMIRRFHIECLTGSPAQLSAVLRKLDEIGGTITSLKLVRMAGAGPSQTLIAQVRARLAKTIISHYGSTEAGGMCTSMPDEDSAPAFAGFPNAGSIVQVVDHAGVPVPAGEIGAIRARVPYMGSGYFRDPGPSGKSFRDGWFYPGDLGYFTATGGVMLSGRDGERINLGGVKIDPVLLDQFLLDYPGVEDAAVFEDVGQVDRPRLAAVVVAAPGVQLEALKESVQRKFGVARSPSLFTRVDAIPRNAMGKVSRQELQTSFSDRRTTS